MATATNSRYKVSQEPRRSNAETAPASTDSVDGRQYINQVRAGCIGRSQAGKTALFRALNEGPVGDYFPSGLHVDVGSPKETAQIIREAEETRQVLELTGLPSTLDASQIRYYLYDGDEQMAVFQIREVIGQILTHTVPESSEEQLALYEDYLKSLLDTDVLWAVIPCPPPKPTARDRRRYANDLRITTAFLREALRRRRRRERCGIAVVLSKIDTLFDNPEEAKAHLTSEVLVNSLAPICNTVERSGRVGEAAIFPVSSFGFGNAVRRTQSDESADESHPTSDPFGGEPTWLIKEGAILEPFNLSTLIIWTLLHGLHCQSDSTDDGDIRAGMSNVCGMLHEDLAEEDRWFVPIKGFFANNG